MAAGRGLLCGAGGSTARRAVSRRAWLLTMGANMRLRLALPFAGAVMLAAGVGSVGAKAVGPATWMSTEEIQAAFVGKTIDGHYRSGRTFKESYSASGRLDYRDEERQIGGHWSVVNGSFCTIYDDDATGGCFRVRRSGSNCYEFYFVARTEKEAEQPREPDWTARGWNSDHKDTCLEGANA